MSPVFDRFQQSTQQCLRLQPKISSNYCFASPADNIKLISVSNTVNLVRESAEKLRKGVESRKSMSKVAKSEKV